MRTSVPLSMWQSWTPQQRADFEQFMESKGRLWQLDLTEGKTTPPRDADLSDVEEYVGEEADIGYSRPQVQAGVSHGPKRRRMEGE